MKKKSRRILKMELPGAKRRTKEEIHGCGVGRYADSWFEIRRC